MKIKCQDSTSSLSNVIATDEELVVNKQQYNKPEINMIYAKNTILNTSCAGSSDGISFVS